MGRPKGSKNKATLLKEPAKAALAEERTAKKPPPPEPLPAPKPVVVVERKPEFMPVWRLAAHRCELLRDHYGSNEEIDDRIWNALDSIFLAKDGVEAERLAKKAVDKYTIHLLSAWAAKRISGPFDANAIRKRISSRRGLIQLAEKNGNTDTVERYTKEVEELEIALQTMEAPVPPHLTPEWNLV